MAGQIGHRVSIGSDERRSGEGGADGPLPGLSGLSVRGKA